MIDTATAASVPDSAMTRARRDGLPHVPDSVTVLVRRDGTLQLGWRPEARVVLTPPDGVTPDDMIAVLRLIDGRRSIPDLYWRASELGVDASVMTVLLAELERRGVLSRRRPSRERVRSTLVIGRGPLADAVARGLSPTGRVTRRQVALPSRHAEIECVVMADSLLCPPEVSRSVMDADIPHLPVRLRDGTGVIGPLVLPGHSACLECVELTRCDYDREWPHLAAQLLGTIGCASGPTVAATAAFATAQVTEFLDACADSPAPVTVGHSIEVDLTAATTRRRQWPRHPLCRCGQR
ncbi:MAG: TOMM precursor leader peptide-binding protein [Rhodococcus sp. (in: high G+C Gram-positive bacteria)]